jgi:hypothetical protein
LRIAWETGPPTPARRTRESICIAYYTSIIVDKHAINTPDELSYAGTRISTDRTLITQTLNVEFYDQGGEKALDRNHPHQQQDRGKVNDFVPRSVEPILLPMTALPLAMEIATAFSHQTRVHPNCYAVWSYMWRVEKASQPAAMWKCILTDRNWSLSA